MQPTDGMVEGVIYRDKWRAACMIQYCDICGKKRLVAVRHGKPINTRCHPCSNQTAEKRTIMSKCHKGKHPSPEASKKRSESLKRRYRIDPSFREKVSNAGLGRVVSDGLCTKTPSCTNSHRLAQKVRGLFVVFFRRCLNAS